MPAVLVILVILFVAISVLATIAQGKGSWSSAFEQIAARYGGQFVVARLIRRPAASFSWKQLPCRVRCYRRRVRGAGKFTEFRIAWPAARIRMLIHPVTNNGLVGRSRNLQPVALDDPEFASRFHVLANRPEFAKKLMSPGVRWQFDQLNRCAADSGLKVAIDRGWMVVTCASYIRKAELLDDFVRYSLELFDQLILTTSEGIEFHDHIIAAVEQLKCPVCSCDIHSQMVICVRCKTPHCHDCWLYNGKCGMYACDETRFAGVGAGGVGAGGGTPSPDG